MTVITNSGPLMALAKLGLLHLLPQLYGKVLLPEAVYSEVVSTGRERGYSDALFVQAEIKTGRLVVDRKNVELPPDISILPLDAGEKEVLFTALCEKADMVLLDDLKARQEAKARDLTVKGTLGVIVQAYHADLLSLSEVETVITIITERDDIWIAKEVCRRVLTSIKRT